MKTTMSRETWREAYDALLRATVSCGLPEEIGKVLARDLHSERSIRRMTSYLVNAHPTKMEDIADEMIAIIEERERWIRKKEAEESNASYTEWLNSDLREPNE